MGRDGATTRPEKVFVVSINLLERFRVDATINQRYLLQRIHTRVPDPVLGDMNFEHEFSDGDYVDVGDGIRFPTVWPPRAPRRARGERSAKSAAMPTDCEP